MFRRFVIVIAIFLLVAVVAADRLGAIVAGHVLASKVKTDEHLPSRPSASVGGIPFLTQALLGKYRDVTIDATNIPVDGVTVTSLTARLHGVHIPLGAVLHGSVAQVPVDKVSGTAFVSFANINTYLSDHHSVGQVISLRSGAGNSATVVDRVQIGGKPVVLRGVASASVSGNVIELEVTSLVRASSAHSLSSTELRQALANLHISLPLHDLPFRIKLSSVILTATGASVTGGAANTLLGAGHPVR